MNAADKRGLSRVEAAAYIGVGVTTFDKMISQGAMPKPKTWGLRNIWDRRALDAAFDRLPGGDSRATLTEADPWGDLLCD